MLTEGQIASITYTNESKNETKARVIVPVTVPKDNVRAIDVSKLSEDDQQIVAALVTEYKAYIAGVFETAYKFEDWVAHTKDVDITPTWRTFKVSNIQINE